MNSTASDLTIEHYQRPEVKAAIIGYCRNGVGARALNASQKWYKGGKDPNTVMLRGPADYDATIKMGRTLYATLDILEQSVFEQATTWDDVHKKPITPIGDLSNCLAFTLSTDIDGIGDITNMAVKVAVEAAAQFHVDYLRERGIEKSVYCLYSGGGIYVHLHHGLFAVAVGNTDLTPAGRMREYRSLCVAYNRLIGDISQEFFRRYPEHVGKVKFDKLNNQKRIFKVLFSIHKRLPYAVIPLDPAAIKIDLVRASLPLADDVLRDGANWYQSFDQSEKPALITILKEITENTEEAKKVIRDKPQGNGDISRMAEPLDQASFPPCMKNIVANAQAVEGRHRALGILATYLYQVGWSRDSAFELWAGVADRCGVEHRIFDTEFGRVSCPRCDTIEKDNGGYPSLNLHRLGFCVPDEGCRQAVWPGNYSNAQQDNTTKPLREIIITGRHMQDITADSLPELVAYNSPPRIFVKAGCLVQITEDEKGIVRIELLSESALRSSLSRCARYMKLHQGKTVASNPPMIVVKDLIALPKWPGILPIVGLITSPVVRHDGSIICLPGYDAATGLYYTGTTGMTLNVPDSPTREDAVKAAAYIMTEVFGDFPFKDDASRANTMAALLTTLTLPLIGGNVPLGLFDKPQAGTGASLLTEIIAEMATGEKANMQTAPGTDEEWRKAITAVLLQGPQIVVIDNVTNMLRSSKLSQMLTARTWSDRMLGQNKMLNLPQTAAWFVTGNNIQLGGDIGRRAYWIRLDAALPRPWLRDGFRHPKLMEWVKEHRGGLLSLLLVMVRAWIVAGRPKGRASRIGSFEEWSFIIGGILTYAGVQGFLGNAEELYDSADQEIAQWDLFLEQWQLLHRDDKITAAQLKTELTDFQSVYKLLQNEMPEDVIKATDKGARGATLLGQTLRRHADQVFPSGRKLTCSQDRHTKAMKWSVITIVRSAEVQKLPKQPPVDAKAEVAEAQIISTEILDENEIICNSIGACKPTSATPANGVVVSENGVLATSAKSLCGGEPEASSGRIRAAAICELGMAGWIDPRKIAHSLKQPLEVVEACLRTNFVAYERTGGGIGYRQPKAVSLGRAEA